MWEDLSNEDGSEKGKTKNLMNNQVENKRFQKLDAFFLSNFLFLFS